MCMHYSGMTEEIDLHTFPKQSVTALQEAVCMCVSLNLLVKKNKQERLKCLK